MSVEFDPYRFENKIRAMVLDLLSPSNRRMVDMQENIEELLRHDNQHKKRIDQIDFNFSTIQGKMAMIDDVHKTAQELKAGNISFESEISMKIQQITGIVDKASHKLDDLTMKVLTFDENFRHARADISEYANTVNVIKDSIIVEHRKLANSVEKSVSEINKMFTTTDIRLTKSEHAVLAFCDVSLPQMLADVENSVRNFKEFKKSVTESLNSKFDAEEFPKFMRSVKFENEKVLEKIKGVNDITDKIEEYLDNYLPIEIWNSVSEGVCKLEPKYLKNFVEHDERKLEGLRNRVELEHLDIDGISNKALESYSHSTARREVMKIEVEKADMEERAAINRARKSHSRKKNSSNEKKRIKGKPSHESEVENSLPPESPKKSEIHHISQDSLPPDHQNEVKVLEDLFPVPVEIPVIEEKVIEIKIEKEIEKEKEIEMQISVIEPPEPEIKSTFNLIPQNSEESNHNDSELEDFDDIISPSPLNGFSPVYSPSIDIIKFETELENLRLLIEQTSNNHEALKADCEIFKETTGNSMKTTEELAQSLQVLISKLQQDLETNLNLMHEEIKQLILRNKQEKTDNNKLLALYHSEILGTAETTEKLDQQFSVLNELLINLSEIGKILHLLTLQEEEDRQSLQLLGYAETKGQKQSYISLKSDCLSCSGQNPLIMTAFKMACLNYSPSSVKYRHKTYTRKQLIHALGSIANAAWAQASSKASRYPSEFGSYQSIPTLSEEAVHIASKKHRYNRSQFIELPSLQTSKLQLDVNETPFSSTKTFKK